MGAMAARAVSSFFDNVVAFRVTYKTDGSVGATDSKFFFVPVKPYCGAAYSRADGAQFHAAIFNDLTNPQWNSAPSRDAKQGCYFVGR